MARIATWIASEILIEIARPLRASRAIAAVAWVGTGISTGGRAIPSATAASIEIVGRRRSATADREIWIAGSTAIVRGTTGALTGVGTSARPVISIGIAALRAIASRADRIPIESASATAIAMAIRIGTATMVPVMPIAIGSHVPRAKIVVVLVAESAASAPSELPAGLAVAAIVAVADVRPLPVADRPAPVVRDSAEAVVSPIAARVAASTFRMF